MEAQVTQAFVDLVLAISAFVGAFLVAEIRKRISFKAIQTAQSITRVVVGAAEQVGGRAGWNGEQKLKNALASARDLGEKHGITLTNSQWANLIEAEVKNLHNWGAELAAPPAPDQAPPAEPAPVPEPAPDPTLTVSTSIQQAVAALRAAADQLDTSASPSSSPAVP